MCGLLYGGGLERKFGTDESAFNEIFMESSPAQLREVLAEYRKVSSYDLARAVEVCCFDFFLLLDCFLIVLP